MQTRIRKNYFYIILFLALFLLCFLFPYTGDDWAWGSQLGIDRLKLWFENYNGRYFGNFIVLVLTRSNLLKTLAMCLCIGGIVVILNEITKRPACGLGIIVVSLVFMPVLLLRQAVVWTSGFSNYVTSIFLTLIYIFYIRKIYSGKPKNSYIASIPLAILGFGNALIVEHLTIYNVILGIYVIIFTFIKYKKMCLQHFAYLAGTVIGTIIMFSNGAYHAAASGTDSYRTISTDTGILSRISENFKEIARQGFLNNFVLLSLLAAVCLVLWFENKDRLTGKIKTIGYLSIFVIISYTALSFMNQINTYWNKAWILLLLEVLATIVYVLSLIAFILILPLETIEKVRLLFILFSAGFMIAPLFVVTPIGPRCFFAPYVMLIYFVVELSVNFNETHRRQFANLSSSMMIFAVIGALYLFYIYGTIAKNNQERIAQAVTDSQNGKHAIKVQELPYKDYVWCSDVQSEPWSTRFKMYYGIDTKISIKMIPNK